ncbi:MAG: autotransporter-associated beta strand repeat-containing protein [Luteolibacter sp.]
MKPYKRNPAPTVKTLLLAAATASSLVPAAWADSFTTTGVTTAWNTTRWNNTTDAAPYTSAYTANNDVQFTSGNYSFAGGMGAAVNVGNVTVSNGVNVNFSAVAGTFATNGAVRTFTIGTGALLDFSTQGFSTGAGTGFIKNGSGVLAIQGGLYTGGFTLNTGTVIVRGVNGMGGGVGNVLTINGGAIGANASRTFNDKYNGGIVIGGNFQLGVLASAVSISSDTANLTYNDNPVSLGAATRTITIGANGTYSFNGVVSGNSGVGLTVNALGGTTGSIVLGNAGNTYSGNTTVSAGTLRAGINNALPSGAGKGNLVVNTGGTFDLNAFDVATNGLSGTTGTVLNNVAGTKTLTVGNNDATASFAGVIGGGTGLVALTKTGAGTQTLTGANSYLGATTVNAGALKVDGSTSTSSAVAVNNAAILRGIGTVGGAVTLNNTSSLTSTGTLTLANGFTAAGTTNSISGGTIAGNGTVNSGTTLNLASGSIINGSVAVNGSLSGTGTVGALTGSGSIDAGNSPGILTASTVNSQNLAFNFEFTSTGIPTYSNAGASVNDVLRLTSATPFTVSLASTNLINIYLASGILNNGDIFNGGFYTDNNADFLNSIQNASFAYYLANGSGSTSYNGANYDLYTGPLSFNVSTVAQSADFGAGTINGYVTQFEVVPEPSTLALVGLGLGALTLRRRRA